MDEDIVEYQADIARLMLHHIHASLAGDQYIRGVLPAPPPAEAVRIVTGPKAHAPDGLTAYEIPLDGDDLLPLSTITGILRTLHTGTHIYPSRSISSVMGMNLVRVEPATVEPADPTPEDTALTLLHALAFRDEEPKPRLLGFLLTDKDRLRLYFDTEDPSGTVAADVRTSGALTALIAALPSLITEEERLTVDDTDPHCSRVMDLTGW
ncbi:hypothetical protein [Streptomyces jumonjinensis]|uniref:hypothetical protein n=1 Tax=Streptomyces jumonjinensis TaxID=1945 RepID=UPI0012955EF5|nr:hypothetical protein [Streptomyces jumonjinensis]